MRNYNKKALYESIMRNVKSSIKQTLNESQKPEQTIKSVKDYLLKNWDSEIITSYNDLVKHLLENVYYTGGYMSNFKEDGCIFYWDIDFNNFDEWDSDELKEFFNLFATSSKRGNSGMNYKINLKELCETLDNNYSDVYSLLSYVTSGLLGVY